VGVLNSTSLLEYHDILLHITNTTTDKHFTTRDAPNYAKSIKMGSLIFTQISPTVRRNPCPFLIPAQ